MTSGWADRTPGHGRREAFGVPSEIPFGTYDFSVPEESAAPATVETSGSKSAQTRMRILNAAAHVLSRKGNAGTRLSDVADQARLQAPAIYYYFPSREALVEEVMWTGIWLMREHVGQVLAALPPGTGAMERIDAAVAAHLRYALDISDYTTAAIRNAGQVPDDILIRYSAEAAKYGEIWHALLHDAAQAGLLRPELEPMAARMLVLGALNWAAEWWDPGRRTSLDTVVRTAQSLVRNGLSAGAGSLSGERPPVTG
jgi:AcrR family transcriptional regulator